MSDQVGNTEDRFSHNEAQLGPSKILLAVDAMRAQSFVIKRNIYHKMSNVISLLKTEAKDMIYINHKLITRVARNQTQN